MNGNDLKLIRAQHRSGYKPWRIAQDMSLPIEVVKEVLNGGNPDDPRIPKRPGKKKPQKTIIREAAAAGFEMIREGASWEEVTAVFPEVRYPMGTVGK